MYSGDELIQTTKKNFKVKKILNNSSIIVSDMYKEFVIISKGIGFGLAQNKTLPKGTPYERVYKFSPGVNQFSRLTNGYDDTIIEIVMDTIQLIVEYDINKMQGSDLLSISDHLAAAYTRIVNGEAIKSFFSYEIRALYPESFQKSDRICKKIEAKYDIEIPLAEISYIALHIQNLHSDESKQAIDNLNIIILDIYALLCDRYGFSIAHDDLNYLRFITHLRFLVEGAMRKKRHLTQNVNDALFDSYPQFVKITDEIIEIIESVLKIELSKQENTYILLHLVNLLDEMDEERI